MQTINLFLPRRLGLFKSKQLWMIAIILSILLHLWALAIRFNWDQKIKQTFEPMIMTAVMINASTDQQNSNANYLAQANLDAGGTQDGKATPTSPVERSNAFVLSPNLDNPVSKTTSEEEIKRMEEEIKQLMTAKNQKLKMALSVKAQSAQEQKALQMQLDLAAKIEKDFQSYASRPKKKFIGVNAKEYSFAPWIEAWQRKVEAMGIAYYPPEAQGKIRGELILTAAIDQAGQVVESEISKSSGYITLDKAAEKILQMAAPFEKFTPEMRKNTDIVYITRIWKFGPKGLQELQATNK